MGFPHPAVILPASAVATFAQVDVGGIDPLLERLGLFGGLLAIGWYFWRRDERKATEAKREVADHYDDQMNLLRERISELENRVGELVEEVKGEREQHAQTRDRLLAIVMEQTAALGKSTPPTTGS